MVEDGPPFQKDDEEYHRAAGQDGEGCIEETYDVNGIEKTPFKCWAAAGVGRDVACVCHFVMAIVYVALWVWSIFVGYKYYCSKGQSPEVATSTLGNRTTPSAGHESGALSLAMVQRLVNLNAFYFTPSVYICVRG